MTFLHPSYLWALAGLAIPLAIHLLSRKEGKVIRVGSIRHVEESNTSQFKSIRLNEVFLLILRMLMVTLLALFMSGAQCSAPDHDKKVAYVEKGINADSLTSKGYEIHEMPEEKYWAFAEELNRSPYETIVLSYSKVENFQGMRIMLNDNIRWITAESKPAEYQALAWSVGDSVFVRNATSDAMQTTYSTSVGVPDSIDIIKPKEVSVSSGNKLVIAALNVLKKEYKLPIKVAVVDGKGTLDETFAPKDQDAALNNDLVIEVFRFLYPELQKTEVGKDARVLPDELAWSSLLTSSPPHLLTSSGIEKYLILLFVLSLAAERFVAINRNQ